MKFLKGLLKWSLIFVIGVFTVSLAITFFHDPSDTSSTSTVVDSTTDHENDDNDAMNNVLVDVPKIAGQSKPEVSKYLEQPFSCEQTKHGQKCKYEIWDTEIVYINGKADWITVGGIDHLHFSQAVLKALGLQEIQPTFGNKHTLRWEPYKDFVSISVHKGQYFADYAYIKIKTE